MRKAPRLSHTTLLRGIIITCTPGSPIHSGGPDSFFNGFFVLHDFHRTVFVGHRKCLVSNHFFDHKTKGVLRVDPARRGSGEVFRTRDTARHRGFNSPEARKGAQSIVERSRQRAATVTPGKGFNDGNFGRPNTGGRSEEQRFTNRGNNTQTFERRSDRSVRQPNNSETRNETNSRVILSERREVFQ